MKVNLNFIKTNLILKATLFNTNTMQVTHRSHTRKLKISRSYVNKNEKQELTLFIYSNVSKYFNLDM